MSVLQILALTIERIQVNGKATCTQACPNSSFSLENRAIGESKLHTATIPSPHLPWALSEGLSRNSNSKEPYRSLASHWLNRGLIWIIKTIRYLEDLTGNSSSLQKNRAEHLKNPEHSVLHGYGISSFPMFRIHNKRRIAGNHNIPTQWGQHIEIILQALTWLELAPILSFVAVSLHREGNNLTRRVPNRIAKSVPAWPGVPIAAPSKLITNQYEEGNGHVTGVIFYFFTERSMTPKVWASLASSGRRGITLLTSRQSLINSIKSARICITQCLVSTVGVVMPDFISFYIPHTVMAKDEFPINLGRPTNLQWEAQARKMCTMTVLNSKPVVKQFPKSAWPWSTPKI